MKDTDDDRAAILAVIDAETNAYIARDFDAWDRCWHDGPEIRRIQTHVGTGVTIVEGPDVRAQMRRILTGNIDWQPVETFRRENINLVVTAEMAWVSYDQIGDMSSIPKEMAGRYHELKILQKFDGIWKIVCITGAQLRVDHMRAPLVEVDEASRILWMNAAAKQRLPHHPRLDQRAGKLSAKDPQAGVRLLEAVEWLVAVRDRHTPCVGEDIVNRAIALGQDDTGLAHICWAILRDGKLLIAFEDADQLDQQLAGAADVYGLSGAQEKLARLLVTGEDLGSAASALHISPNTAKTHLQRIYDKMGVRAQPALVRLLLNAEGRGI